MTFSISRATRILEASKWFIRRRVVTSGSEHQSSVSFCSERPLNAWNGSDKSRQESRLSLSTERLFTCVGGEGQDVVRLLVDVAAARARRSRLAKNVHARPICSDHRRSWDGTRKVRTPRRRVPCVRPRIDLVPERKMVPERRRRVGMRDFKEVKRVYGRSRFTPLMVKCVHAARAYKTQLWRFIRFNGSMRRYGLRALTAARRLLRSSVAVGRSLGRSDRACATTGSKNPKPLAPWKKIRIHYALRVASEPYLFQRPNRRIGVYRPQRGRRAHHRRVLGRG